MLQDEIYTSREQFMNLLRDELAHDFDMMITAKKFMQKHRIDAPKEIAQV